MEPGITIVMPALNEENNIRPSILLVQKIFKDLNLNYELIIINDGSIDNTGNIADEYANKFDNIIVSHHDKPQGMGSCYKKALKIAKLERFMLIVSKNECEENSIKKIINSRDKADIIIPYTTNQNQRDFARKIISFAYTKMLNLLTGLKLQYYNGTVLHKTKVLQSINFNYNYHTFQSEALIKLINMNYSYLEVPTIVNWNKAHKTSAFKLKNIISVITFVFDIIKNQGYKNN
tara:strand:- start:644 stop:1345 length:702 start_codon:yes stop_codon:yes gene_type:complete